MAYSWAGEEKVGLLSVERATERVSGGHGDRWSSNQKIDEEGGQGKTKMASMVT